MIGSRLEYFLFASYAFRDEQLDVSGLGDVADKIRQATLRTGVGHDDRWELAATVTNVTDEDGTLSVVNSFGYSILRPREYKLSFTYWF